MSVCDTAPLWLGAILSYFSRFKSDGVFAADLCVHGRYFLFCKEMFHAMSDKTLLFFIIDATLNWQ